MNYSMAIDSAPADYFDSEKRFIARCGIVSVGRCKDVFENYVYRDMDLKGSLCSG